MVECSLINSYSIVHNNEGIRIVNPVLGLGIMVLYEQVICSPEIEWTEEWPNSAVELRTKFVRVK